jgi:tRNA/tmRNA/rRNA uracil-C5-methylase (TrmA/RlmC/RlmD family)
MPQAELVRELGRRVPPVRRAAHAARKARMMTRQRVRVGEAKLFVPRDMRWAFSSGTYYERNVTHALYELTLALGRPVVYDVGANGGYYTLALAPVAERVHAFEPVASTFEILRRNVNANNLRNVSLFQVGLSEKTMKAQMSIFSTSAINSTVCSLPG